MRVPDAMLRYATEELVLALRELRQDQIDAIHAVVGAGHFAEEPAVPWRLLHGAGKIISERNYYRVGKEDPETGRWLVRPGWKHQPAFLRALSLAKKLALAAAEQEELASVASARRAARLAAPRVVGNLVGLAVDESGRPVEHKDQIAAAKLVLQHAGMDADAEAPADGGEADWWMAAG